MNFVRRHGIGIVAWSMSVSWCFHLYLLMAAIIGKNSYSITYEVIVLSIHEVLIVALCAYAIIRRRRGAP